MTAVFPTLVDMERWHGSIIRAVARRRRTGATMPGRRLFSWRQGIGTLPRVLAERLGPALKTGTAVGRIRRSAHGFRIEAGSARFRGQVLYLASSLTLPVSDIRLGPIICKIQDLTTKLARPERESRDPETRRYR